MTVPRTGGVELRTAAEQGAFAVDETTGNRMIKALEAVVDALEERWARLQSLQERPPIGGTAAARHVATRLVDTATDERGLLTRLTAVRAELPSYVDAIRLAKKNYAELEQSAVARLREIS